MSKTTYTYNKRTGVMTMASSYEVQRRQVIVSKHATGAVAAAWSSAAFLYLRDRTPGYREQRCGTQFVGSCQKIQFDSVEDACSWAERVWLGGSTAWEWSGGTDRAASDEVLTDASARRLTEDELSAYLEATTATRRKGA